MLTRVPPQPLTEDLLKERVTLAAGALGWLRLAVDEVLTMPTDSLRLTHSFGPREVLRQDFLEQTGQSIGELKPDLVPDYLLLPLRRFVVDQAPAVIAYAAANATTNSRVASHRRGAPAVLAADL